MLSTSVNNPNLKLGMLVAWFVFLQALFFSLYVTPLGDTPDESGHYAYVTDIAKGLPLPKLGVIGPDDKGGIPYGLWGDEWGSKRTTRVNQITQHPPLYYTVAAIPYKLSQLFTHDPKHHAYAVRSVSAISAGLFVWILFKTLLVAGVLPNTALQLSLWLPLLPMFTHISSGISNDGFLTLMAAFSCLFLVRFLTTQHIRYAYMCAFWLACVGATKMTGWLLVAGFVGIILFELRTTLRQWLIHSLAIFTFAFSTAFAWMLRNQLLHGDPFYVLGSDLIRNITPTLSVVDFLKKQPFIEWLAHHTYGLLGFSGYCLTAPDQSTLDQFCSGVKIISIPTGFPISMMLTAMATSALLGILFAVRSMTIQARSPSHTTQYTGPHSIQTLVQLGITRFRSIHWIFIFLVLVFAYLLFQHFTAKSFRLDNAYTNRLIIYTFGLIFAWSVLAIYLVFADSNVTHRLAGYGVVLIVLFTLVVFYQSYQVFIAIEQVRGVQGRYLFPFYPLLIVSVGVIVSSMPWSRAIVTAITASLLIAHFVAYTGTYIPFFNSVRLS